MGGIVPPSLSLQQGELAGTGAAQLGSWGEEAKGSPGWVGQPWGRCVCGARSPRDRKASPTWAAVADQGTWHCSEAFASFQKPTFSFDGAMDLIVVGVLGSSPLYSQLPPGLSLTRGWMWASMGPKVPPNNPQNSSIPGFTWHIMG